MSKSILQIIQSCSVRKIAPENSKYSRNETILKIGHHAKAIYAYQNPHFGSKIEIPKNMSKSILQIIQSCSAQKTPPENNKYSRNQIILKIAHHPKVIAHAKSSLQIKNLNSKNMSKSILQINFSRFVQKPLQKTLNIREMRPF